MAIPPITSALRSVKAPARAVKVEVFQFQYSAAAWRFTLKYVETSAPGAMSETTPESEVTPPIKALSG